MHSQQLLKHLLHKLNNLQPEPAGNRNAVCDHPVGSVLTLHRALMTAERQHGQTCNDRTIKHQQCPILGFGSFRTIAQHLRHQQDTAMEAALNAMPKSTMKSTDRQPEGRHPTATWRSVHGQRRKRYAFQSQFRGSAGVNLTISGK
jgi:hypothetical protein